MGYNKVASVNFLSILIVFFTLTDHLDCSPYRVRSSNRPECRDKVPRRSSDLPSVVITGYIEQTYPSIDSGGTYTGSVLVKRVLRGPTRYQSNRVTIDGFGDQNFCYSKGEPTETWIFQLTQMSEGYFRLNGTMLKLNLDNLDRMNALVEDQVYRKRPDIIELPCEKKYCENNAICIEEPGTIARTRCVCLTSCDSKYEPVCGSNGETFVNECKLRMDSCRRGINLFVRYPSACDSRRTTRSTENLDQLSSISLETDALIRDKKLFQ